MCAISYLLVLVLARKHEVITSRDESEHGRWPFHLVGLYLVDLRRERSAVPQLGWEVDGAHMYHMCELWLEDLLGC
jgi:hypothetical protein